MTAPLLAIDNLGFAWPRQAELLDIPCFRLERGESLFLKGPSGSGKTTLLGLIGGAILGGLAGAERLGLAALLTVTVVWGTTFPAMKQLSTDLSALQIIWLRFGLAALVLTIIAGIKANEGQTYRYPLCWRLIK